MSRNKPLLSITEITLFPIFGAIMYGSKVLMQSLPNIHLIGMFVMVFTIVYRAKALIPIYIYVLLEGIFTGFSVWWFPYLYVWLILFGVTMLLPKNLNKKVAVFVYPIICSLHGLLFGTLFAPFQALCFHLNFRQTLAWIAAGLSFDLIHAAGNLAFGTLILPLVSVIRKAAKQ